MKYLSFEIQGTPSFGALRADAVIDLKKRLNSRYDSLRAVLDAGVLDQAEEAARSASPDYALEDITFRSPVPEPGKIICVGVNYANRNDEYKDGSDRPRYPSLFLRTPSSFTAHGQPILRPPESDKLDYEGEIVLLIGKAGRRISEQCAAEHIAGFTIMNEGTLRDWVRHAKFNVTQGKNFEQSGAIGPWMATPEEMPPLNEMRVRTWVNEELRQDDTTASMAFPIPYLLSYISTFIHLRPGDLIATGTPTGAGARFDPPRYLVPGDVVEVEVDGVGRLRNSIEDEVV